MTHDEARWEERKLLMFTIGIGILLFVLIAACMAGCPKYNVYRQELKGEGELRRAQQNRQIKIQEAKAILESADDLAAAEVKQAMGVAEANKILGDSLKGNEGYLRYLFIKGLQDGRNDVIYIPTEAGLPILEAGKRKE
jgi:hypothetical protein